MKKYNSYVASRLFLIIAFSLFGTIFPLKVDSKTAYYLLSSAIQGLAAILGLFIVSFVFIKDDLNKYRNLSWVDYRGGLHNIWNNSNIRNTVIMVEQELPSRLLLLIFQLVIIIYCFFVLSIMPLINNAPDAVGLFLIDSCLLGAVTSFGDFAAFIYWGVMRPEITEAIDTEREKEHENFLSNIKKMPPQTEDAIKWALQQKNSQGNFITIDNHHQLVDKVREYFNINNIEYTTFSYNDLYPFLPKK